MAKPKPRLPGHRARWGATLAILVAVAVVVIVVFNHPATPHSNKTGTTTTGATRVERRNLVATDTESGTLSYDRQQTVYSRLSGTITWVPAVGDVVRPGHTLFTVDNEPVVLMNGSTPAYRELTAADVSGPDVYELNRNLVELGYDPDGIVVDDEWQAATTAGIDVMQYRRGEAETGQLSLGQVVFLPGAQMIQSVDTTVGSTAASYHQATGSSGAEFVDYSTSAPHAGTTTTPPTTRTTTSPNGGQDNLSRQTLQQLLRLVREQERELQAQARASHSPSSSSGNPSSHASGHNATTSNPGSTPATSGGSNATAVLTTSSTKLVVAVDLSASSQSEATIGEHVTVKMPNGSNVRGRVTAVSPVAQSSSSSSGSGDGAGAGAGASSSSGSATVPVTIVLDRPAKGGGLDQASVSVSFVQSRARHVLSVPVTALLATSGSSFAVQEADAPHRLIGVQTGLFAAGYVEISGRGVYPGLPVTDSQG